METTKEILLLKTTYRGKVYDKQPFFLVMVYLHQKYTTDGFIKGIQY